MRVLTVGGGSGGHVTPVVAVLREIKEIHPDAEIRFWCDQKFFKQAVEILAHFDKKIPVQKIIAGKLRRYHHLTVFRQLFWPSLMYANIKDGFLVVAGFFQSLFKLIAWRPDVVFAKGGYVCLPVGIAAKLLGLPLVIHDSDAHPGLTNRVLSRWADKIATGAPLKYYPYPKEKTRYVGIPVVESFRKFSEDEKIQAKNEWGVSSDYPLVVVTGGGLGASRINNAVVLALSDLLEFCSVVLISGVNQYDELRTITPQNNNRFQLHSFVSNNISSLFGAADAVVTRAGATTIVELALLEKPTILIPNGKLTGGHQLKNAAVYLENGAAKVIDEDEMVQNPHTLVETLNSLFSDRDSMESMAKKFAEFSKPNAARDVADMVLSLTKYYKNR
jgi:UDP-N-acetylglucosamine--N-acetylmuramyl-(pentapeptide) pyrophosphoryl-undecaprenol N-acetylglucosamine transferase